MPERPTSSALGEQTPDHFTPPKGVPEQGTAPEEEFSFPNYADKEEVAKKAKRVIDNYYTRFQAARSDYEDAWEKADTMVRCRPNSAVIDATRSKDTNITQANTASTLFLRQVRTIFSQGVHIQFSQGEPFTYRPLFNENVFYSAADARYQAEQHNVLAHWNMQRDNFENKSTEIWNQAAKYGNCPVWSFWKRKRGLRRVRVPRRAAQLPAQGGEPQIPKVEGWDFEQREFLIENHFSIQPIMIDDLYADPNIGDIQLQNCVVVDSLTNLNDLFGGVREGYFDEDQVVKLMERGTSAMWGGEIDKDTEETRATNMGIDDVDDSNTGLYKQHDCFVRLPIDDKGKWDAMKNEPMLFWATIIGNNLKDGEIVRLQRNPHPNDEIPIVMLHLYPDDTSKLYHLAPSQIVESNYEEQQTAKNQAIDNKTLINNRPMVAVEGEVRNIGPVHGGKVFYVENQEALRELTLTDNTGTTINMLEYLDFDSDRALGTDKPITGEALGQRTTATEAQNVFEQAKQPHLVQIKYFLNQFLKWYGRNLSAYWHWHANEDQVIEITGEPLQEPLKPAQLFGDFDIEVSVVDEFVNSIFALQAMNTALQTLIPNFPEELNKKQFLLKWFELNKWPDPSELIKWDSNVDAERVARIEFNSLIRGQWLPPDPNSDLATKIRVMKGLRLGVQGLEDQFDQQGVALVDQHLQQAEFLLEQRKQALGGAIPGQTPGLPTTQTPGQQAGNSLAAIIGAESGGG